MIVSGGGTSRVFQIDSGVTASISELTITGGSVTGVGGGVSNSGTLTLTNCTIMSSGASSRGGGLANLAGDTATLTDCIISGDGAGYQGGGIESYGTLKLYGCHVTGNVGGGGGGGGVNSQGSATSIAMNTTISGNSATAGLGGGLAANGTATLTDCTISGNSAGTGGGYPMRLLHDDGDQLHRHGQLATRRRAGIYMHSGTLNLTDSTVPRNTASTAGGIGNPTGSLTIENTIVSANTRNDEAGHRRHDQHR